MDATHAPHRIERPCMQRLRVWLKEYGLDPEVLHHNSSISELYESALRHEKGTLISSTGALAAYSGAKTGRSPSDKRVVCEASTERDVWWGPVNFKMTPESFVICRERALNYLSTKERLYVFDGTGLRGQRNCHRNLILHPCQATPARIPGTRSRCASSAREHTMVSAWLRL